MDDFDRPLNEKGLKDAPIMAKRLKERNIKPHIVLTSPANRALSTCYIITKKLGVPLHLIISEPLLYHASPENIFQVIKRQKDDQGIENELMIIFGHNPGLTELANQLSEFWIDNLPTCGVASYLLNIKHWTNAGPSCGKLDFFDYPKK